MAYGSSNEPYENNGICKQSQLYGIDSVSMASKVALKTTILING